MCSPQTYRKTSQTPCSFAVFAGWASCSEHHDKWFQFFWVWFFALLLSGLPFIRSLATFSIVYAWVCVCVAEEAVPIFLAHIGLIFTTMQRMALWTNHTRCRVQQKNKFNRWHRTWYNVIFPLNKVQSFYNESTCSPILRRPHPPSPSALPERNTNRILFNRLEIIVSKHNDILCGTCEYVLQSFRFFTSQQFMTQWMKYTTILIRYYK